MLSTEENEIYDYLSDYDLKIEHARKELIKKKNRDYKRKLYNEDPEYRRKKALYNKRWREKEKSGEYIHDRGKRFKLPTQEEWDEIQSWYAERRKIGGA
jgi:hypothetical protein